MAAAVRSVDRLIHFATALVDEPVDLVDFAPDDPAAFYATLDGNEMNMNITCTGILALLRLTSPNTNSLILGDGRFSLSGLPGGSRLGKWTYTKLATRHRAQLQIRPNFLMQSTLTDCFNGVFKVGRAFLATRRV